MATVSTAHAFLDDHRKIVIALLALIAIVATLIGIWLWAGRAEHKAIHELRAEERQALYDRTLKTLQATCAPPERPKGLDDYCRRQANFILEFPECDSSCENLARQQASQPSR